MDLFYGLRSAKHHIEYSVGSRSKLKGGIPQCNLGAKDRAHFEHLRDTEKQRYEDECKALKALADAQQYYQGRMSNWAQFHTLQDALKFQRLSTKLDRKLAQAQNKTLTDGKKRTYKAMLQANREANDRARYQTVDVNATASQEQGQGQGQWGDV
jgi:hypothetical protein